MVESLDNASSKKEKRFKVFSPLQSLTKIIGLSLGQEG
jgi:hypothetical protein